jgi:2-dehydro-3-deoxy-D-arabinonate dehydratase
MALWRLAIDGVQRLAAGPVDVGPVELLPTSMSLDAVLAGPRGSLASALGEGTGEAVPQGAVLLPPVESQEVWAAGVTYRRSRDARMEEAAEPDHYDLVYDADRPELFFKASAARTRGPNDPICVRADSTWDVPEAELGLVLSSDGGIVGYVIGDDVSSRSIEGENPLYLPQAKNYTGSCAIGPCIVTAEEVPDLQASRIELQIRREGQVVYEDQVALSEMHRDPTELADWLFRALDFPVGVILLTGTALIPPSQFTLRPGDEVSVGIEGLGTLKNPVELVGRTAPAVV